MNIFRRHTRNLFKRPLHSVFMRPITDINKYASKQLTESYSLMESKRFEEASEVLSKVLKILEEFKGSEDYNKILLVQAQCFNSMKRYKDSEQIYQNIIEYMKFRSVDFSPQQFLHAKINLLTQYLMSNLVKGVGVLEDIYQQHYKTATEEERALIDYFQGVFYAIEGTSTGQKKADEAKQQFTDIINKYRNVPEFCIYSAHNIAMLNWWKIQESPHKDEEIKRDIAEALDEKNEPKIITDVQSYMRKFYQSNFVPQDFEGVFKNLLFSLTLANNWATYADPVSVQKILRGDSKVDPENLLSLLSMSEILLETKGYRQKGRELLDLADNIAEQNSMERTGKAKILRAAQYIDTKQYEEGIYVLDDLIEGELQPWEGHNKLMAYKFMVFAYRKMNKDIVELKPLEEEIADFEREVPKWSAKLGQLYVPIWKHLTEENE